MGMVVKRCDAAFIGGGVATSSGLRGLLCENTARGDPLRGIEIAVIEPREHPGVGTAWDIANRGALSNMTVPTLRLYGGINADLNGFEIGRASDLFPPDGEAGDASAYISRTVVGERLARYYRETLPIAGRSEIGISHVRGEATQIVRTAGGFRITTETGFVEARAVVLALGLLSVDRYPELRGAPGYQAEPWAPGDLASRIGDNQRVAIIGMGPTAIDWALQLGERDLHHPVLMASPSGRAPAIRPVSSLADSTGLIDSTLLADYGSKRPFSPDLVDFIIYGILDRFGITREQLRAYCSLSVGTPREMLERTLAASHRPQALFEALKVLDRLAPALWRWSSEPGRAHIMRKWSKIHAQLSYAIPATNGAALLAQFDSGGLIARGGLVGVRRAGHRFELDFKGDSVPVPADILINATGFEGRLAEANNVLVRALLEDGLLHEARYGGAMVDYATGRVLDPKGRRVDGLFVAGGSLMRSAAYVVNSLLGTSEHAIKVGAACARHLQALLAEPCQMEADQHDFVI